MYVAGEEVLPLGFGDVLDEAVDADAGAVDEHVDLLPFCKYGGEGVTYSVAAANVALDAAHVVALGLQALLECGCLVDAGSV